MRFQPDFAAAHCDLADALVCSGQIELAIVHYRKVLEIDPDYVKAHCKVANVLMDLGRPEEAMAHYEQALAIDSYYAEAAGKLAWLLATCPNDNLERRAGPSSWPSGRRAFPARSRKFWMLWPPPTPRQAGFRRPSPPHAAGSAWPSNKTSGPWPAPAAQIAGYEAGKPFHQMSSSLHEPQTK